MRCCCCCSVTQSCLTFVTQWTAAHQASLSFTVSLRLLKLMSIESMIPSNHLILCRSLLLPSVFPSSGSFPVSQLFQWVFCITCPKNWSFSFSISPSNEYSGLTFFRIDWFDLLAVQGTLKGLFQHHSLKASILQCSAFFVVQLSHPYMTTGKTIALTRRTFVSKVMYYCLGNPMDRGAWWATTHGVQRVKHGWASMQMPMWNLRKQNS